MSVVASAGSPADPEKHSSTENQAEELQMQSSLYKFAGKTAVEIEQLADFAVHPVTIWLP